MNFIPSEHKLIKYRFVPLQSFYWFYDTKLYFLKDKLYALPLDLYNQVKHYSLKQNENNC